MGRNNHNKIKNGAFRNRRFDINSARRYAQKMQKAEQAATVLTVVTLVWALLFASGVVVSPVYAETLDSFPLADQYLIYNTGDSKFDHIQGSDNTTLEQYTDFADGWTNAYGNLSATETLVVNGTFTISSTLTISKASVIIDFNNSVITASATTTALDVRANYVTVKGGNITGSANGGWCRFYSSPANATLRDCELHSFAYQPGIVGLAYGSSNITVENVYIHDVGNSTAINVYSSVEPNNALIRNVTVYYMYTGVMLNSGCGYNRIENCDFSGWHVSGGHAIYDSNNGNNNITNCVFHDGVNGACVHFKGDGTTVNNCTMQDLPSGAPPFSIYADGSNGDLYNLTIKNSYYGFSFGTDSVESDVVENMNIYDCVLDNVTYCFLMNGFNNNVHHFVNDTWIHSTTFIGCNSIFPTLKNTGSPEMVEGLLLYDNVFDSDALGSDILDFVGTIVYNNTGVTDYYMLDSSVLGSGYVTVKGFTDTSVTGIQNYDGETLSVAWNPEGENTRQDYSIDGANQTSTTSPAVITMDSDHTAIFYFSTGPEPTPTPSPTPTASPVPTSTPDSGGEPEGSSTDTAQDTLLFVFGGVSIGVLAVTLMIYGKYSNNKP
jgi:hypothetical protein